MNAPKKYWWVILVAVPIAIVIIPPVVNLFKKESKPSGISQVGNNTVLQQGQSPQNLSIAGNSGSLSVNQQSGGIGITVLTNQQLVNVSGGNVTVNNSGPDTVTKLAIEALYSAVNSATTKVELTRTEVKLLAKVLKDLDERTDVIKRLPDGRSMFGGIVAGNPTVLAEAMTNLFAQTINRRFTEVDWKKAFQIATNAVALNEAEYGKSAAFGEWVMIRPGALGGLYEWAAVAAHFAGNTNYCVPWIEKAFSYDPNLEIAVWRVFFLRNYGVREDAHTALQKLIEQSGQDAVDAVRKQLALTSFD